MDTSNSLEKQEVTDPAACLQKIIEEVKPILKHIAKPLWVCDRVRTGWACAEECRGIIFKASTPQFGSNYLVLLDDGSIYHAKREQCHSDGEKTPFSNHPHHYIDNFKHPCDHPEEWITPEEFSKQLGEIIRVAEDRRRKHLASLETVRQKVSRFLGF